MIKIKKLGFFDKIKLTKNKELFLNKDNNFSFPFNLLLNFSPIKPDFLPNYYILKENKEIQGLISVSETYGNNSRLNINQLGFNQNNFDIGKQLIEYVLAKYAAKGVSSFIVKIDESNLDLLNLFSTQCGFRNCSYEKYWEINKKNYNNTNLYKYRSFHNSEASIVSELFNDKIITHFKPSLQKSINEFKDTLLQGLITKQTFKYIAEDSSANMICYINISTTDNHTFLADIIYPDYYEVDLDEVFRFINKTISKRTKNYKLFTHSFGYLFNNEKLENYLYEQNNTPISTKIILSKDFYKMIKSPTKKDAFIILNNLNNTSTFKTPLDKIN